MTLFVSMAHRATTNHSRKNSYMPIVSVNSVPQSSVKRPQKFDNNVSHSEKRQKRTSEYIADNWDDPEDELVFTQIAEEIEKTKGHQVVCPADIPVTQPSYLTPTCSVSTAIGSGDTDRYSEHPKNEDDIKCGEIAILRQRLEQVEGEKAKLNQSRSDLLEEHSVERHTIAKQHSADIERLQTVIRYNQQEILQLKGRCKQLLDAQNTLSSSATSLTTETGELKPKLTRVTPVPTVSPKRGAFNFQTQFEANIPTTVKSVENVQELSNPTESANHVASTTSSKKLKDPPSIGMVTGPQLVSKMLKSTRDLPYSCGLVQLFSEPTKHAVDPMRKADEHATMVNNESSCESHCRLKNRMLAVDGITKMLASTTVNTPKSNDGYAYRDIPTNTYLMEASLLMLPYVLSNISTYIKMMTLSAESEKTPTETSAVAAMRCLKDLVSHSSTVLVELFEKHSSSLMDILRLADPTFTENRASPQLVESALDLLLVICHMSIHDLNDRLSLILSTNSILNCLLLRENDTIVRKAIQIVTQVLCRIKVLPNLCGSDLEECLFHTLYCLCDRGALSCMDISQRHICPESCIRQHVTHCISNIISHHVNGVTFLVDSQCSCSSKIVHCLVLSLYHTFRFLERSLANPTCSCVTDVIDSCISTLYTVYIADNNFNQHVLQVQNEYVYSLTQLCVLYKNVPEKEQHLTLIQEMLAFDKSGGNQDSPC